MYLLTITQLFLLEREIINKHFSWTIKLYNGPDSFQRFERESERLLLLSFVNLSLPIRMRHSESFAILKMFYGYNFFIKSFQRTLHHYLCKVLFIVITNFHQHFFLTASDTFFTASSNAASASILRCELHAFELIFYFRT